MTRPVFPAYATNRYAIQQPTQRLIAAAKAAGVTGGKDAIDAWARETNWTGVKR